MKIFKTTNLAVLEVNANLGGGVNSGLAVKQSGREMALARQVSEKFLADYEDGTLILKASL